jgi:hypothetical protein
LEYGEYFFAFRLRKDIEEKHLSKYSVPYEKRTAGFYGKKAWTTLIEYIIYSSLVWFARNYPPKIDQRVNSFLWPNDIKSMIDNLIFGLILCLSSNIRIHFII